MEMTGEQQIQAPVQATWEALNDPEILKACVPGCESIELTGPNEYQVLMTARVGPVSAKFKGRLVLSDLKPPHSYSLAFEGQGGVAGFGKGGAQVSLAAEGGGTKLSYNVTASVGGKLAQIGSRLVDMAARKLAEEFFVAFNEKVASLQPVQGDAPPGTGHDAHAAQPLGRDSELPDVSARTLAWVAAGSLIVFFVALFAVFR